MRLPTPHLPQDGAPHPAITALSTRYRPANGTPAQRLSRQRFSALTRFGHRRRIPNRRTGLGVDSVWWTLFHLRRRYHRFPMRRNYGDRSLIWSDLAERQWSCRREFDPTCQAIWNLDHPIALGISTGLKQGTRLSTRRSRLFCGRRRRSVVEKPYYGLAP